MRNDRAADHRNAGNEGNEGDAVEVGLTALSQLGMGNTARISIGGEPTPKHSRCMNSG